MPFNGTPRNQVSGERWCWSEVKNLFPPSDVHILLTMSGQKEGSKAIVMFIRRYCHSIPFASPSTISPTSFTEAGTMSLELNGQNPAEEWATVFRLSDCELSVTSEVCG